VDVRILAATNRDLHRAMEEGTFRNDLFWRLNVLAIHIPPLRERKEDIYPLVEHFLRHLAGGKVKVSPEAMGLILDYSWPGNVRELKHALERAVLLARDGRIEPHHLPDELRSHAESAGSSSPALLDQVVKEAVLRALERNRWNKSKAARELGIDRSSLIRKIKKYGLG